MKLAVLSDSHYGVRNDNPIYNVQSGKFFKELFFPTIKSRGIKHVFHLGDVYDRRKYVNFHTAQICHDQFLAPLKELGLETHILRGNHDQYHKNSYDVNALKTLIGPLSDSYNIKLYDEAVDIKLSDGTDILMVPWICDQNSDSSLTAITNSKSQICFGHLELNGFEMFKGIMADHGLSPELFKKFDIVASGHYHHRSVKDNVHYLGSPYEFYWSDWNDPRGFHIFDTETREFEFIQNEDTLFKMIQYDDVIGKDDIKNQDFTEFTNSYVKIVCTNKTNLYDFDVYLDKIKNASPIDVTIVEDVSLFSDTIEEAEINEAEDTITILSSYIDGLNMNVETENMKALMKNIYAEAIATGDII